MISTLKDTVNEGLAWDRNRDSFPGEHLLALAAGIALVVISKHSTSRVLRMLGSSIGSTLVIRAASGRDGVAKLLPYLPMGNKLLP